eukprot:733452-Hanusia_phi.AAC.1
METPMTSLCMSLADGVEKEAMEKTGRIIRVDENLYISNSLQQGMVSSIKDLGVKTVINIQFESEGDFKGLEDDLTRLDIEYHNDPLDFEMNAEDELDQVLSLLDKSKKPCLVFCEVGVRAAAVGVAFSATRKKGEEVLGRQGSYEEQDILGPTYSQLLDEFTKSGPNSKLKTLVAGYT